MSPTTKVASDSSKLDHGFSHISIPPGIHGGVWKLNLLSGEAELQPAATTPEDKRTCSSCSSRNPDVVVSIPVGELQTGLRWSEIRVGHVIGRGPQGEVHKAQHRVSKALYAMKVVPLDKQTPSEPILRELSHLMALQSHTNVLRIQQAFAMHGELQIVTEFADVGTLQQVVDKVGPLSLEVLSCIFRQVLKGLEFLHDVCCLTHRDLKPSNILLNSKGHVKLGDYAIPAVVTSANRGAGIFEYMSPERLMGQEYGPKADIWSLGVTVAEVVLGVYPLFAEWPQSDLTNPFTKPSNAFMLATMIADGRAYVDFDHLMPKIQQFRSSRPVQALLHIPGFSITEYDSKGIAHEVRTFVIRCMAHSFSSRPSAVELLVHPMITEYHNKADLKAWLVAHELASARPRKSP